MKADRVFHEITELRGSFPLAQAMHYALRHLVIACGGDAFTRLPCRQLQRHILAGRNLVNALEHGFRAMISKATAQIIIGSSAIQEIDWALQACELLDF